MTADLTALRARLAELGARHAAARPIRASPRGPLADRPALPRDAVEQSTPFGEVVVREEWVADGGDTDLGAVARCLGLAPTDVRRPLFLDTETTGLAGGTGTVAFLVGLAWRDAGGIRLAQYFLKDYDQETALLWAVGECVRQAGVLVSYNGRSFDWPLLQTRLVMRRADPMWASPPHLDLLTLTRRIFRPRLPNCTLQTIEQAVLELHRAEDVPGAVIPSRYFAWLRGAGVAGLEPVFAHNRQDVLSMVVLLSWLEAALRDGTDLHPLDRFGRARFLEARGFLDEAIREYRHLWDQRSTPYARGAIGLRLARLLRRSGRWPEARTVLDECWRTQCYPYQAAIELAKLLEHQARDIRAARRLVADALQLLAVAVIQDRRWRDDLERRGQRLDRRLGLRDGGELALTG